jgi:hypothetical protein
MKKVFALTCLALLSCSHYPIDSSGRDLYEMESVWQYLKTYCLWQDRVPTSAFQYDSPEKMLDQINDTLRGKPYTCYEDSTCGACGDLSGQIDNQSDDAIYWSSVSDSTMYLKIQAFTKETYQNFLSAIIAMRAAHRDFRNMIIDLRDNGGGDIEATDSIIEAILPANTPYLVETYRKYDQESRRAQTVSDEIQVTKGPQLSTLQGKKYAVLVNGGSASASEMLTAALKDGFSQASSGGDSVVIVGDTTWGKGIGQICIFRLYLQRSNLKITFMRMRGVTERIGDYHRKGIVPDVLCEDSQQPELIALKILEPSAHSGKQMVPFSYRNLPIQSPPEAVIVAPPEDRLN